MQLLSIKTFLTLFLSIVIIFIFSSIFYNCSKSQLKSNERLCFAVIGSTAGESPYSGLGPGLPPVIKAINEYNPTFLIHLGGMVRAGSEWHGIAKIDIDRQYKEFCSFASALDPIFYPVIGDSELFNNSSEHYSKYMNRRNYYSFNYGSLHFIVIDSTGNAGISEKQKEWIKEDIAHTENSEAIFIFTHNPFFVPRKNKVRDAEIRRHKDYEFLHNYFTKCRVKAVFSGKRGLFFKLVVDGIEYINTGCGGFNKNEINNAYNQYYIINYKNSTLIVQPKIVKYKSI